MMIFGIVAMTAEMFYLAVRGYVSVVDWMEFAIYAVVAVCGAIKRTGK